MPLFAFVIRGVDTSPKELCSFAHSFLLRQLTFEVYGKPNSLNSVKTEETAPKAAEAQPTLAEIAWLLCPTIG